MSFLTWQGIGYHVLLGNSPSLKESERFRKETKFSKPTSHSLVYTQSLGIWDSFEDLTQPKFQSCLEALCGGSISMYFCFCYIHMNLAAFLSF